MARTKTTTKTEIYAYETTPYGVTRVEGGYAVKQDWWDKIVSPVFATEEEARTEMVKIAKAAGCYHALRRRVAVAAILLCAALCGTTSARAGTTCYWIGNYYYCSGDYGTTTCYRVGDYTYCN